MPDFQGSLATFNPQWAEIPLDCCHCQLLCIFLLFTSSKNYILFMCSKISITLIFFSSLFFWKSLRFLTSARHIFISFYVLSAMACSPALRLGLLFLCVMSRVKTVFKTKHLCVPPTSTGWSSVTLPSVSKQKVLQQWNILLFRVVSPTFITFYSRISLFTFRDLMILHCTSFCIWIYLYSEYKPKVHTFFTPVK